MPRRRCRSMLRLRPKGHHQSAVTARHSRPLCQSAELHSRQHHKDRHECEVHIMSEQGTPTAILHLGDTKHIEPGKTYSIEVEQLVPLDDEAVKNIIQTFEQATGAKAVVIHKAKVNDSGVVTMPVEELRKLTQAVARVRELATEWFEDKFQSSDMIPGDCMAYEEAGELLLKALDGEQSD